MSCDRLGGEYGSDRAMWVVGRRNYGHASDDLFSIKINPYAQDAACTAKSSAQRDHSIQKRSWKTVIPVCAMLLVVTSMTSRVWGGTNASGNVSVLQPLDTWDAEWKIDGYRTIHIHRMAGGQKPIYYQKPILALREAGSPPEGWPAWIHEVRKRDDQLWFRIKVIGSTKKSLEVSREELLKQDKWLSESEERRDRLKVKPWPTTAIEVTLRDSIPVGDDFERPLIARGMEPYGGKPTDTYDVWLRATHGLTEQQLMDLLKDGRAVISYRLKWDAVRQQTAVVQTETSDKISKALDSVLEALNDVESNELFLTEKKKVKNELRKKVIATIASQGPEAFNMLPNVELKLESIFEGRLVDLNTSDQAYRDRVAKYLEPVLQERSRIEKNTTEKQRDTTVNVTASPEGTGPLFKISRSDLDKLKRTHDITFQKTDKYYRPASIRVYTVNNDAKSRVATFVGRAFAQIGRVNEYRPEADNLPVSFTDKVIADLDPDDVGGPVYGQIPLGAMMCYFGAGDKAPPGYAWADGKAKWPLAAWVPEGLQGMNVPNMEGKLVGGVNRLTYVGQLWDDGKIVLPPVVFEEANVKGDPGVTLKAMPKTMPIFLNEEAPSR